MRLRQVRLVALLLLTAPPVFAWSNGQSSNTNADTAVKRISRVTARGEGRDPLSRSDGQPVGHEAAVLHGQHRALAQRGRETSCQVRCLVSLGRRVGGGLAGGSGLAVSK
jgi:hypothetical protein